MIFTIKKSKIHVPKNAHLTERGAKKMQDTRATNCPFIKVKVWQCPYKHLATAELILLPHLTLGNCETGDLL